MTLLEDIKASGLSYDEYVMKYLLKGKYKHYCIEWDFMAIDETHPEFMACSCFEEIDAKEWETIQKEGYSRLGWPV